MPMRRSLRRAAPSRDPKVTFTIVTEGKNTEPDYFRELQKRVNSAIIKIEIIGAAGAPITISEKAKSLKTKPSAKGRGGRTQSFGKNDEVWAVFDRDEHKHVPESIAKCKAAGVEVGFSNPCFEIWMILHYTAYDKFVDHHVVQADCEATCPGYTRKNRKTADFISMLDNVEAAEKRAAQQYSKRRAEAPPLNPPFTTVFKLTRRIRGVS